MKAEIKDFDFKKSALEKIDKYKYGTNWPVVYILNNEEEAYVGETLDAERRTEQHLQNPARSNLKKMHIITHDTFNKSVILDLESYLIQHMSSDTLYRLQNGNGGISNHDYYSRSSYEAGFVEIWSQLRKLGIAQHTITEIENSDLFKYSPYKALTKDQVDVMYRVLELLMRNKEHLDEGGELEDNTCILVEGSAGTGKTVLAIYLMKILTELDEESLYGEAYDLDYLEEGEDFHILAEQIELHDVGLVIPQQSLRKTVKNVFKSVAGLDDEMVISPLEVPKKHYDLLIVDEAHRLRQRKALNQYPPFDDNNRKLGLDKYEGTELDWIFACSDMQLLFYDPKQSVKPSDIPQEIFSQKTLARSYGRVFLTTQMRCRGGSEYVEYVRKIFSETPPASRMTFDEYDVRLYDDVGRMTEDIKELDQKYGLCRTVAGYAWKWESKKDKNAYDIEIGDFKSRWNSTSEDWINSENSVNEIGCIHTVQGYDLNYAGVIFGNEISYDFEKQSFTVDKKKYFDHQGKTALRSEKALHDYILNIYMTLMTRGIRGTFLYVCDNDLRMYLEKFFEPYRK